MHTSHSATDHSRMIFQCPLCSSVPTDQRDSFMNDIRFSVKSFEKGDVIVTQGSKCEFLYILVRGEISTEMADEKGDFMKVEQIKAPNPLATAFIFNRQPLTRFCYMQGLVHRCVYTQRKRLLLMASTNRSC